MSARSLRSRIVLAFAATTFLLSLLLAVPSAFSVGAAVEEEIAALVREELEETRAHCDEGVPPPAAFAAIAADLSAQHPENPLAWRVWHAADGRPWGDFGSTELLARVPPGPVEASDIVRIDSRVRMLARPLGSGLVAAIVLDGGAQRARFERFVPMVAGAVLLATLAAAAAGRLLGGRVGRMLEEVASFARNGGAGEDWVPPARAPREVQELVVALQDSLRAIRAESERVRLHTSGLAHELRSPLQNLMGETQVALLRERDPAEYRRVLESHLDELQELSRMVDNLVALSSVEEARRRNLTETFDLGEEARLRLKRELERARKRGVDLVLSADEPLVLEGDRESLLLALCNVVTNAIEWSPSEGRVEVGMHAVPDGIEILVDDAGPGVPPAERTRIFEPFHGGRVANGRRVGYGLGLALTDSAVRAQGGRIEVGDSPLGGARFRILLPAG